jgi:hypothetical protein
MTKAHQTNRFFTRAITAKGQTLGYGVYDSINGMSSEHAVYVAPGDGSPEDCLRFANEDRDERNSRIAALARA